MSSKRILGRGGKWSGAVLAVALPGALLTFAGGCNKSSSSDATPDPSASAAVAPDPGASSAEATPPAPVVAGDPDIPINEAIVGTTPVSSDYAADTAPPAAITEERPASPDPADVWVPGYWWWSTTYHRYVWVTGGWRNPPPEQVWTPGNWVSSSPTRWIWMPGFWGTKSEPAPSFAETAPPPPRFEVEPPAPGVGYYWTPGYYAWRGGEYAWVGGAWGRPPVVGLEWVAPRYVFSGGRYYYQSGRWDHDPAHRGVAYMPNVNIRPGEKFTPVAVPPTVTISHARFVNTASQIMARGGERQANGTIVLHANPHVLGGGTPGEHGGPNEHPNPNEHPLEHPTGTPNANPNEHPNPNEHLPLAHPTGTPPGNEHPGNEPRTLPNEHQVERGGPAPQTGNQSHANPNEKLPVEHGAPAPTHGSPPPGGSHSGGHHRS